ncbi:MAG TPA: hypothetical protein EYG88_07580 [Desulfocapsa sulfexigens]|nr:hypothetical protein [Desulfocapsa sulfexigens]
MKEKIIVNGSHYLQDSLQFKCWTPVRKRRQCFIKRLLKDYQKEIDSALAAAAIGLMFVLGTWCFLIQLAEY